MIAPYSCVEVSLVLIKLIASSEFYSSSKFTSPRLNISQLCMHVGRYAYVTNKTDDPSTKLIIAHPGLLKQLSSMLIFKEPLLDFFHWTSLSLVLIVELGVSKDLTHVFLRSEIDLQIEKKKYSC